MVKRKTIPAKRNAILSLQFYRDRQGTPNFLITSNPTVEGENAFTGLDRMIFARNLIESSLCSKDEILFLCDFFKTVEGQLREQK